MAPVVVGGIVSVRGQLGTGNLRERLRPFDPHRQSWSSWTPLLDRLGFLIDYQGDAPCSEWHGSLDAYGYGQIGFDGRKLKVHRIVYELLVGPIPDGMDIDHTCHNKAVALGLCAAGPCAHRRCQNPFHMEPVPNKINTLRGGSLQALNARKTHCVRGHPFDLFNTYTYMGARQCKTCRFQRQYERRYGEVRHQK